MIAVIIQPGLNLSGVVLRKLDSDLRLKIFFPLHFHSLPPPQKSWFPLSCHVDSIPSGQHRDHRAISNVPWSLTCTLKFRNAYYWSIDSYYLLLSIFNIVYVFKYLLILYVYIMNNKFCPETMWRRDKFAV